MLFIPCKNLNKIVFKNIQLLGYLITLHPDVLYKKKVFYYNKTIL